MTELDRPAIAHAARCQRRAALVLRASWRGAPQWWCPTCGRTGPADDARSGAEAAQADPGGPTACRETNTLPGVAR